MIKQTLSENKENHQLSLEMLFELVNNLFELVNNYSES